MSLNMEILIEFINVYLQNAPLWSLDIRVSHLVIICILFVNIGRGLVVMAGIGIPCSLTPTPGLLLNWRLLILIIKILIIILLDLLLRLLLLSQLLIMRLIPGPEATALLDLWLFLLLDIVIMRLRVLILLIQLLDLTLNPEHLLGAGVAHLLLNGQVEDLEQGEVVEVLQVGGLEDDLGDDELDVLLLQFDLVEEAVHLLAGDGALPVALRVEGCGDVLAVVRYELCYGHVLLMRSG
jgi:hypothetical protein